jgi:hypothetical protein
LPPGGPVCHNATAKKTVYHSINKKFTVAQELPKLSLLTVCAFGPQRKKAAATRRSPAVLHAIIAEAQ